MTKTTELYRHTIDGQVWAMVVEHYPHLVARWRPVT